MLRELLYTAFKRIFKTTYVKSKAAYKFKITARTSFIDPRYEWSMLSDGCSNFQTLAKPASDWLESQPPVS